MSPARNRESRSRQVSINKDLEIKNFVMTKNLRNKTSTTAIEHEFKKFHRRKNARTKTSTQKTTRITERSAACSGSKSGMLDLDWR